MFAQVDASKCIGCGLCAKECPASIITMMTAEVCAG
jgi:ferredoxin